MDGVECGCAPPSRPAARGREEHVRRRSAVTSCLSETLLSFSPAKLRGGSRIVNAAPAPAVGAAPAPVSGSHSPLAPARGFGYALPTSSSPSRDMATPIPRRTALLLALTLAASPLAAQARGGPAAPPLPLVDRTVLAMGGAEALRGLHTTVLEFNSSSFALGQEEIPLSPPRATLSYGKITTDWQGSRRLTEQELRLVTGAVKRSRQVINEGIGMTELNGAQSPLAPAAVWNEVRGMRLQPHRFLLAALENPAALRALPPATFRGETLDGIRYATGADTMNLWFDRPTGLVVVSEFLTDDPILGDRRTLTWYTRWQARAGVKLPWQVDTEVNGRLLSHNVVTDLRVNETLAPAMFVIPDSIAARATRVTGPVAPPAITVSLVELAAGVRSEEHTS